ncbi:hypothetical protein GCM10028819_38690 [Spirosoma humi]
MATPSTPDDSSNDAHGPEKVLENWLKATSDFYTFYQRLMDLINQQDQQVQVDHTGISYLGQCPVGSLLTLVLTMQAELEKLVYEMDQLDEFSETNANQHLSRFVSHTSRLNRLNRKARILLNLALASSS